MKTQIEIANQIADAINANEDYRATVTAKKCGEQVINLQKDTGGKRGFIGGGQITVSESVDLDDEAHFTFRYDRMFLKSVLEAVGEFEFVAPEESPKEEDTEYTRLVAVAAQFRRGEIVEEADLVACVSHGLVSEGSAMNRDW